MWISGSIGLCYCTSPSIQCVYIYIYKYTLSLLCRLNEVGGFWPPVMGSKFVFYITERVPCIQRHDDGSFVYQYTVTLSYFYLMYRDSSSQQHRPHSRRHCR